MWELQLQGFLKYSLSSTTATTVSLPLRAWDHPKLLSHSGSSMTYSVIANDLTWCLSFSLPYLASFHRSRLAVSSVRGPGVSCYPLGFFSRFQTPWHLSCHCTLRSALLSSCSHWSLRSEVTAFGTFKPQS